MVLLEDGEVGEIDTQPAAEADGWKVPGAAIPPDRFMEQQASARWLLGFQWGERSVHWLC